MLFKAGEMLWEKFMGLTTGWKWGVIVGLVIAIVAWLYGLPIIMPVIIIGALWFVAKWFYKKWKSIFSWKASGGTVTTPLTMVGERGPELVTLPMGSTVHSNARSKQLLSGGGGNTINITINARDTSDAELRRIANRIGDMVNSKINRTTSSRTMG